MSANIRSGRSHLFLVRLWAEEAGERQTEWRGKVQQVVSGETHNFRSWPELTDLLLTMASTPLAGRDVESLRVRRRQRK